MSALEGRVGLGVGVELGVGLATGGAAGVASVYAGAALVAVAGLVAGRRLPARVAAVALPAAAATLLVAAWGLGAALGSNDAFPSPIAVVRALGELVAGDRLWRDAVASLFRVTWGYLLAVAVGVPIGLVAGWYGRAFLALNPLLQGLRPISPIAWIPIAILWFGIGDGAAIYLILYASFFPIAVGTSAAVRGIPLVHQRTAENFGLRGVALFREVILPAALPQIITSLRLGLGVAWLVIVAAEMVGMDKGLGYLVNDARNMGSRYDLVVATMVVIGALGIALDLGIRQLERLEAVRWGFERA